MDFVFQMKELAKSDLKKIVLPEGNEERNLKAAEIIHNENIADVILVGSRNEIEENAKKFGVNIEGITIEDPQTSERTKAYANELYELRKKKGVTQTMAENIILDPMYYATMMVKNDDAHGMVSGAVHTTGDLLRPGLQIIKTAPGISVVSSFFIMILKDKTYGENGQMLFADCAVNPNPNADELAAIFISIS